MRRSLHLRYALGDLSRNRASNTALAVVLVLSAFLMATGAIVMERTIGSIDELFDQAKPPHFLQMHTGDYDLASLDAFAAGRAEIDSWLVEDTVGFDGSAISWENRSGNGSGDLSESLIDNLFVTQNRGFDYLLDEAGAVPHPAVGEVYAPIAYRESFGLDVGDELTVAADDGAHALQVRGFVRDAQMASSMSSATRFLVSDVDFETLGRSGQGTSEVIVEYRLHDPSQISAFQQAYESEDSVPKNGQAVTYQMIRLINAFSDGLVAIALVFVSLLLIVIAMTNVRFMIRGKIEDDIRQIGAMKAIGLPHGSIARMFLTTYLLMTAGACVIGGLLAIPASWALTQSIQINYASASFGPALIAAPAIGLVLIFGIVLLICTGMLRTIRRITIVNALVHGSTLDDRGVTRRAQRMSRGARRSGLRSARGRSIGWRLTLLDLRAERGQWVVLPIVFFLATVLVVLPTNLLNTFESPRFVTYMGAPRSDIRADLQFSAEADAVHDELLASMNADNRVKNVRSSALVLLDTHGEQGWDSLRITVGEHSSEGIEFLHGRSPASGEIALSLLNAQKYGLSVGDPMTIGSAGSKRIVRLSGIYQDVTSGGYTAKMVDAADPNRTTGYVVYADASNSADISEVTEQYSARFATATVIPMGEYVAQTLSHVTDALRTAAVLSGVVGLGVALLITSSFLGLRMSKDRRKMGVLTAMGFSGSDLARQLRAKTVLSVALGVILGIVATATLGQSFVGLLISVAGLGLAEITFITDPLLAYVGLPLLLIVTGYVGAFIMTSRLQTTDKSLWLR